MNKDSLAKRVYLNTKHIALGVGGVVIVAGALYRYGYMQSDTVNNQLYQSESLHTISSSLVGSIVASSADTIAISTDNEAYLAGYAQLKECGKIKTDISDIIKSHLNKEDSKYHSYNSLLNKLNTVNHALYALHAEGFLRTQYSLPTQAVLQMGCDYGVAQVGQALGKLSAKADLKGLNWTEHRVRNFDASTHGAVSMPLMWHAKKNPWRGLDGCIYLANTKPVSLSGVQTEPSLFGLNGTNSLHAKLCQTPDMYKQAKVLFPINKDNPKDSIVPLSDYEPTMVDNFLSFVPLLNAVTLVNKDSGYTVDINGHDVPVGFNAQLTINPNMQIATTQIAQCFTGKLEADNPTCQKLNTALQGRIPSMEANALARQVGIAIIDVPSGRVEVATGSTNSCFDKNYGVSNSQVKCLDIPKTWQSMMSSNQAKENPALYTSHMPASTIKPMQALAMVRAFPNSIHAHKSTLQDIMARSSTEQVLDILTCSSPISSQYRQDCQGFFQMQKASHDMGWNNECQNGERDCGKQDVLYGQKLHHTNMQKPLFYGKLLTDDEGRLIDGLGSIPQSAYAHAVQQLSGTSKNGGYDWSSLRKTSSNALSLAVQESYGQRNARATPLGVASAMRTLLASASSDSFQPTHIVEHLWTAGNDSVLLKPKETDAQSKPIPLQEGNHLTSNISQAEARAVIELFTKAHYAGTASKACQQSFGVCSSDVSTTLGYHIFSKTGTTTFSGLDLPSKSRQCADPTKDNAGSCYLKPISWFVLGVGTQAHQWSKVMVIMTERNWNKAGMIQDDNMASQVGFNLMKVLHEESLLNTAQLKDN